MKLLFVNADLGYGGAEKMLAWLASQMSQKGLDVTFLTFRNGMYNYQNLDTIIKRKHIQLESAGGGLLGFFKTSFNLHKFIKDEKFDVAVAFLLPSQIRLLFGALFTNTKVLFSQRADPYKDCGYVGFKRFCFSIIQMLFKRADAYVFQTVNARDYYPVSIQNKSVVIPNPIKPLVRTKQRVVEKRIVNVARLDLRQKRQDILIQAFKILSEKYPEYRLELYGTGGDLGKLEKMSDGCNNIFFMGLTSNVVESIQNAAMFVLTSDFEGIPNALLEAMSLGIPCISTNCSPGGAALLISDDSKGQLVNCGDVKSLSLAIEKFITDKQYAESCGKNAMYVNHFFSEEKIAEKWYKFFIDIRNEG